MVLLLSHLEVSVGDAPIYVGTPLFCKALFDDDLIECLLPCLVVAIRQLCAEEVTCIVTRIVEARNPYLLDNGNIGWVNDDCIVTTPEPTKVTKTVSNCYWLNLRTTPSYGNNIYKAVQRGTVVEYLGMESGWAKIKYDNRTLYCGSSYLN